MILLEGVVRLGSSRYHAQVDDGMATYGASYGISVGHT